MKHGLSEKTVNKIFSVFERFPEIEKTVLYGSRAKGNFKTGSDIDLTLYGEKLSSRLLGDIAEALDDLLLPYTIDLSIFDDLNHAKLREHIERVGVVFYEKKNQNMKAGWDIKTLGDVFTTVTGNTPPKNNADFYGDFIPLVKPPELCNSLLDSAEDGLSEAGAKVARVIPENSILVSCIGNLGKVALNTVPVAFNQQINAILPDENKAIPEFMFYQTLSCRFNEQLEELASGTTVPIVNKSKFNSIRIVLAPLLEQKRLVTLLDEAFESIATAKANAEQNLKNARALFESHLNEVFAECAKKYGHKTVGEISKHSLGKMLDKAKNKGEFKPYLRNINVRWFNFDLSDTLEMKFLPEETEKYTAVKGDVLICEGGYPGRAAIWQSDEPIFFQKALHRVRFHEIEHNKWFVYFLFSQDSSGCLRQHFTGAGIQHFTGSALKQFKIPIPPIAETKFYVAKFDTLAEETQRLETLYSRKIAALDELKKALLHRAFSGEL
ncbi:MAG: restriction endonuclease subunit S [Methylococcaceae bacterium]